MKFLKLSVYTATFVMSIVYLMLAFFLLPTPEQARLESLELQCTSFYKAEQLAMEDFKSGRYHVVFDGEIYSTDRSRIMDSILRADYNIEALYTGCVGTSDEVYHYMYIMAVQMASVCGYDFFERVKNKQITVLSARKRDSKRNVFVPVPEPPPVNR